jgi:hypothetical protein
LLIAVGNVVFRKFRLHNQELQQVLAKKKAENDLAEANLFAEVVILA